MRTFFHAEPVICHAVLGVIAGTIAANVLGIDTTAAVLIAGIVFVLCRGKVAIVETPSAKRDDGPSPDGPAAY